MVKVAAGARITGTLGFVDFGAGVAGGDFNGDGIADLAIAYQFDGSSRSTSSSTVQIIFGGAGVLEGDLLASALAGGSVTTTGEVDIGVGVDVPGPLSFADINGDGLDDLFIGAPRALGPDPATGGTGYVLFGRPGDQTFSFDLTHLTNGTDGQAFFSTTGRNAGSSIISLGDVDGDGTDEMFVGVPFAPAPDGDGLSGLGYVFDPLTDAVTDLFGTFQDPATPPATVIYSSARAFLAEDAAALGDVNGDGIDDFLVSGSGAIGAGTGFFSGNNGEAYLIYGQQGGLPDRIDVSKLDGSVGTKILATDIFRLGGQVESAGDVNGDGLGDFILMDTGAGADDPIFYVVYGQNGGFGASFDLSTSDGVSKLGGVGSASPTDGIDMAALSDVNEDGFGDILVSRAGEGPGGRGEITLLFGSASGLGDNVDLDALGAGSGYRIIGAEGDFRAGRAVAGPGDLNEDGINDIAIGVPGYNPDSNAGGDFDLPGAVYVIYGGAARLAALDALDGDDGIISLRNVTGEVEVGGDPDPDPVTYSLGPDITVTEQNGQDTTFAVTVTRSSAAGAAEIALALSGDATLASGDISRIGGSNLFADGETETTIVYRVTDDVAVEPDEAAIFDLSLVSSDVAGAVGDGQQVVTIEDDDVPVRYDLGADFTVTERNGEITTFGIKVTRSEGLGAATIALTPSGSAQVFTADADYSLIGGSNSFADGETETTLLYRLTDDLLVEFAEDAIFDLSIVSSDVAGVVGDGQQVVTINDDDEIAFFSLGDDFSIAEENGADTRFAITVTRSFAEGEAEIALATSGPGASEAFPFIGSTTFADGETETRIIYQLVDDTDIEPTEDLIFDLSIVSSDAAAEVADGQQVVSIQDDDTPVRFSLGADSTIQEATGFNAARVFQITRSSGVGEAVVNLTLGGTATAIGPSKDYVLSTPSVTFADGETRKTFQVTTVGDSVDEPDETIILGINVVSSVGVAIIEDGTQVITILDDDDPAPIIGTDRDDSYLGGAGNDRIIGRDGDDTIDGRLGDDTLAGSNGLDLLYGGSGNDDLYGGSGADGLVGGAGVDWLYGGSGVDRLFGGSGVDSLFGGTGADLLSGGDGSDRLDGGDGSDRLIGADGNDRIIGADGNDVAFGGNGNDAIAGGSGRDRIEGGTGADRLFGGDDDDTIRGESGKDNVFGGAGDDLIFGGSDTDTLRGEAGDDQIFGGIGNDTLSGGTGDDLLVGRSGNDRLFGGSGDDRLRGDGGNDQLVGGAGRDTLLGGTGDDRLFGGTGNDRLFGEDGNDVMSGGNGQDFMRGGAGNDRMSGGDGRDVLSGEAGRDLLIGGAGDDQLLGGSGNDTITGGAGDDRMIGGGGRDTFVFDAASGDDLIRDFRGGMDRIQITDGANRLSDVQITSVGGNATVRFASTEITLTGFNAADLGASDFIFG